MLLYVIVEKYIILLFFKNFTRVYLSPIDGICWGARSKMLLIKIQYLIRDNIS